MIVDLPATTVAAVAAKLVQMRNNVGAMSLTRVLTLVVVVDEHASEEALTVAADATRQHPSRIIAVVRGSRRGADRIDGQLRVGGDAGASEVVVLRLAGELTEHGESVVLPLLLADSPIVVWWPRAAPEDVAGDPIGRLAQRRITDAEHASSPSQAVLGRAATYVDGDTDLVWTRTTIWRGLLAAALDLPPYKPVTGVVVTGGYDSASSDLLAGWLGSYLDAPVTRARTPAGSGLFSVRLQRESGPIDLVRPDGLTATLTQPGQPPRRLALPRRRDFECLADELARLDADEVYQRSLLDGLARLVPERTLPAAEAIAAGIAPPLDDTGPAATPLVDSSGPTLT